MRAFKQVDVFTNRPLFGNPVAVILDGSGLGDAQMQQIALWTNLSETTFVLPASDPAADYAVRIFTPRVELPFAGHPTLGTAHAVLEAGLVHAKDGRLVQQCAVGLVELEVGEGGLSFRLPPHRFEAGANKAELEAILGCAVIGEPVIVHVGPRWIIAQVADVAALHPDYPRLASLNLGGDTTGLTIFAESDGRDIAVRSFAPADGINEDPVCGSGNGAVAAYRLRAGAVQAGDYYQARQGREAGRDGFVQIRFGQDSIHVGGACVTCVDGKLVGV